VRTRLGKEVVTAHPTLRVSIKEGSIHLAGKHTQYCKASWIALAVTPQPFGISLCIACSLLAEKLAAHGSGDGSWC
jgi:hypothetical protein